MKPKKRALIIEDILNSSLSKQEKAIKIHEHISVVAEDDDEVISVDLIEKSFGQLRKTTYRGLRTAILMIVANNKNLNIFAINRNLLRLDYEPIITQNDDEIRKIVKEKFKLPTLQ